MCLKVWSWPLNARNAPSQYLSESLPYCIHFVHETEQVSQVHQTLPVKTVRLLPNDNSTSDSADNGGKHPHSTIFHTSATPAANAESSSFRSVCSSGANKPVSWQRRAASFLHATAQFKGAAAGEQRANHGLVGALRAAQRVRPPLTTAAAFLLVADTHSKLDCTQYSLWHACLPSRALSPLST